MQAQEPERPLNELLVSLGFSYWIVNQVCAENFTDRQKAVSYAMNLKQMEQQQQRQ